MSSFILSKRLFALLRKWSEIISDCSGLSAFAATAVSLDWCETGPYFSGILWLSPRTLTAWMNSSSWSLVGLLCMHRSQNLQIWLGTPMQLSMVCGSESLAYG